MQAEMLSNAAARPCYSIDHELASGHIIYESVCIMSAGVAKNSYMYAFSQILHLQHVCIWTLKHLTLSNVISIWYSLALHAEEPTWASEART